MRKEICPEEGALFVMVVKTGIEIVTRLERIVGYGKYGEVASGVEGEGGARVSGVYRSGRDGEVAAAAWLHREGTFDGCARGGRLQDVVREFFDWEESFVR